MQEVRGTPCPCNLEAIAKAELRVPWAMFAEIQGLIDLQGKRCERLFEVVGQHAARREVHLRIFESSCLHCMASRQNPAGMGAFFSSSSALCAVAVLMFCVPGSCVSLV